MQFKTDIIFIGLLYALLLTACGEGSSSRNKVKAEVPAMDFHSIKLPMGYVSDVLGGFCHPTSARIGDADCVLVYNSLSHAIEIVDLTHRKPFKQIRLRLDGESRLGAVRGVFYCQGEFILCTGFGACRIDGEGNVLARWSGDEYLKSNDALEGFSIMVPELMTYFNLYNFTGYDEQTGLMTFSIYKSEKENGEYLKKILVLDCKIWEVVDIVDVACTERMKRERRLGILGSVNSIPHGHLVIYNFPASAEVFIYDRKERVTLVYTLESDFAEPYYRCNEADTTDEGLYAGYYFPLRYDAWHRCFWRVQQTDKPEKRGIADKPFSVSRISTDFQVMEEFLIPNDLGLLPYVMFTEDRVMLNRPYWPSDVESVMCFYGLAFTPVTKR